MCLLLCGLVQLGAAIWLPRMAMAQASAAPEMPVRFSTAEGRIPETWRPYEFSGVPSHTKYEMVRDGGNSTWVVRAESRSSASGLTHDVHIDLDRFPILRWRWKVEGVLVAGDARTKKGDDYAARVYVVFDARPEDLGFIDRAKWRLARTIFGDVPTRAINYIWASNLEQGASVNSPYAGSFAKLLAVESGSQHVGVWRSEERNVYRDYMDLYGEVPAPIVAVAIMTDSDDTGDAVVAFYGDVEFAGFAGPAPIGSSSYEGGDVPVK